VTLRAAADGITSRARNTELLLLAGSAAFIALAWRALDAAAFPMPTGSDLILAQFVVSAGLGHIGLRVIAPRAAAQPYAVAMLLAAIGMAFVVRLAPSAARNQVDWVTAGAVLMLASAVAGRHYTTLRRYKYTSALAALLLLVATGLFGTTINGERLWITVAGQTIQTTELIKVFLIVFLAAYLADQGGVLGAPRVRFGGRTYSTLPYAIPLLMTVAVAMGALALLKDLGSIALLVLLVTSALYVATGRARFVFAGILLLGVTGALGYVAVGHVRTRIDVWLDPQSQAQTAGYQTLQSIYAIQAGGVTGEGLGLGEPDAIPAAQTDYVFSSIAEELGLVGAIGVVLLYVLLLFAGLRVALSVDDAFGRLLVACIAMLVAIQAAVIIAGNLRIIPTTGITLPFVSYGGSSLLVNFALIGLLMGISHEAGSSRPR
jgi:cell division protein FtsW (lipid II flippase)